MERSLSLKRRFAAFLLAFTCVLTACFAAAFIWVIQDAESRLMDTNMRATLEGIILYDVTAGHPPRLDQASRLYIEGDPEREIPARFASSPFGYSEFIHGESLHVYKEKVGDTVYVLTRFQGDFEQWEIGLVFIGGAIILLLWVLSALLGYFVVSRALKPVDALLIETTRMEGSLEAGRIFPENALSGPWPRNEVGILANQIRRLAQRLRTLLLTEKNFVSEVSHELRTPLTGLGTSLELLEMSSNLTERDLQVLKRARATSERLKSLIEVFLGIFRHEKHTSEVKPLREIFSALLPAWEEACSKKGLFFEYKENTPSAGEAAVSEILARAVLGNLVSNAIRYTEKGFVKIALSEGCIRISDSGSGISEKDRERIFESGFRGSGASSAAGYGIGLSVAKRCCSVLGWGLELKSDEGIGTEFVIRL